MFSLISGIFFGNVPIVIMLTPLPPPPQREKQTTLHARNEDLLALALRLGMEWRTGTSLCKGVQECVDGGVELS